MNFNWMPFKLVNKREWERIRRSSAENTEKYKLSQIVNENLSKQIETLRKKAISDNQQCILHIDELEENIRKYMDNEAKYQESINSWSCQCKKLQGELDKLKNNYMKVIASNGGLKRSNMELKDRIIELENDKGHLYMKLH